MFVAVLEVGRLRNRCRNSQYSAMLGREITESRCIGIINDRQILYCKLYTFISPIGTQTLEIT